MKITPNSLWKTRKIFLFIFLSVFTISLQAQNQKITLPQGQMTISSAFDEIEKQTGLTIAYNGGMINVDKVISVNIVNKTLKEALAKVLEGTGTSYNIQGKQILIVPEKKEQQQSNQVYTGIITDTNKDAIIGASISVSGGGLGTISDIDGKFRIDAPANSVITISYMGYITKEVKAGAQQHLQITLIEDAKMLDEVVVVGYGTQKKINLTGAVDMVTDEVFENRSVSNVTQALQGTIPNLNISLNDGKPGTTASYNVRGTTSIGQGGSALVLIDGVEGDPALLNPNDIASVSVLKDAASAAIYGARGAFGVVLITTKNPTQGKTSITYSGNVSFKRPTVMPDMVSDGYTYVKMFTEAYSAWNDYSRNPSSINKSISMPDGYLAELERRSTQSGLPEVEVDANGNYVYYGNTDWFGLLYKDETFATDHNISVSSSGETASFYITGRYYGQDGLFRYNSDDYELYNLRAKGSIQVFPWLKVNNNMEYSQMNYHNPINVGEGGGIWRNLADEGHPVATLYNPDGTLTQSAAYTVGDFVYGKNGIDTERKVFKNTTGFVASFLNNRLRLNGDFTYQNTDINEDRKRVQVPYSRKQGVIEYVGSTTNDYQINRKNTKYIATNIYGEYEETLAEKHYIKGMVGYNYEQSTYNMHQIFRNGLIYEDADNIKLALGDNIVPDSNYWKWKILGGFFRVNYVFDNRYLLEVNGRLDGSSKFPSNEQYAFFPSISGGWRVSEEKFWKVNPKIVSDIKLRASYGTLGNGNIEAYNFLELLSISQSERVISGIRPQKTSRPSVIPLGLTWEKATTLNFGLDFSMLSGRLVFGGDIYSRKTKDMFSPGMTLPDVFGATVPKGNYADMTTKGYEISLTWRDNFMLANKPFRYEVRATLHDYKSTIDKYNNPERKLSDYYEGMRVGEIWGYVNDGYYTSQEDINNSPKQTIFKNSNSFTTLPGDIKFKDLDDNDVINYGNQTVDAPGDMTVIGNTEPRYVYSFSLNASWNNFSISTFFQGVGKQDWYPGKEAGLFWGQYNRAYNDIPKHMIGRIWTEDNPNAYFPRYRGYLAKDGILAQNQSKYLQNVAFLRMKTIQVAYNLPESLISKIRMQKAQVYISGENLLCWSPLYKNTKSMDVGSIYGSDRATASSGDRGNGNNYPLLKSVTLGLSITF